MTLRDMGRLSASEYEELRRQQARLLSEDVKISPPPSRARNSAPLSTSEIEQLRQALLNWARSW